LARARVPGRDEEISGQLSGRVRARLRSRLGRRPVRRLGRRLGAALTGGPGGGSSGLTGRDVLAGLSVAILVIPQSLAYAGLAGLPPQAGLYAAAFPPIAAAFLASSPYLQTGPVALTALLTFGALSTVATPGSPEYVQLGALLALVVGLTRVLVGALRVGYVAYLMSEPVLRGFAAAAALLIVASQLPGLLGVEPTGTGVVQPAVRALASPGSWNLVAIALGGGTVALVMLGRRVSPLFPSIPIAVGVGVAVVLLLDLPLAVLGDVPSGFPPLTLDLPWQALPRVTLAGVVIALVGFAEAASVARLYAARERQRWQPDRDFMSQGAANLAAAVTGGFPVGGSFSRTSLNYMLGARSRWSGAITGVTVLLFLPFTALLSPVPIAILSGVVISAVSNLMRPAPMLVLWKLSRPQFLVAGLTFLLTILLSPHVEQAVLLGILAAIGVHLWKEFRLRLDSHMVGDTLEIRPEGVLWFGSAESLHSEVIGLVAEHPEARKVNLRLDHFGRVDLTAAFVLERLIRELRESGMHVRVTGAHPETARALYRVLEHDETEVTPASPTERPPTAAP
jgi:sulfate permease, SulP family